MSPASPPAESAPPKAAGGRVAGAVHDVADFWTRVTDGLALNQLWDQFKEEATASYNLYARDVNWSEIPRKKGLRRSLRLSLALFYVMLLKLSPARRILLLLAVAFFMAPGVTIFQPHGKSWDLNGYFEVSAVLLFVLLVLELADRVTMKRDLEIAREIQTWLVPRQPPSVPGIDIAFATQPANTIAGDFYDAFLRPSASPGGEGATLLVAVADVAGKSVPAALLMATFQSGLRTLASTPGSLVDVVDRLDRYACAHSLNGLRFTTAFIAELDPASRRLTYVNAGHNAPILQHVDGSRERLEIGGVPLGVSVQSAASHYDVGAVQLAVGDTLVVFTDGVMESLNEAGEEYGESRFLADLKFAPGASAQQILQDILDRAKNFTGAARRHDDITCLVLRVTA
ncbi:MAG TPA: PP2C family protein-serine/threonine phosphatase [Candidatus Acidoferrales bacterium]|nr:PP2C family protein-serine/threonine phosphatase [Candidatus Acidoferrales bacterium]